MANSTQDCIALALAQTTQSREPIEVLDVDQIERIRGQLAKLDVPLSDWYLSVELPRIHNEYTFVWYSG